MFAQIIVFAVGSSRFATDTYLNASVLATGLDSAYKFLCALAVNRLLSTSTSTSDEVVETIHGYANAVTVVRTLIIAQEACLGLVVRFILLLLFICWNRRNELRKDDPASFSSVLKIVQNNPEIPSIIEKLGQESGRSSLTLRGGRLLVDVWTAVGGSGHCPLLAQDLLQLDLVMTTIGSRYYHL